MLLVVGDFFIQFRFQKTFLLIGKISCILTQRLFFNILTIRVWGK